MRFILIIFLLASISRNGNSQGEVITSCPVNYDHILCESWLNNLFTTSDAWCTNSPGVTEYEIGYYISPSYMDQVFYYEKLTCCDTESIDPCEYRFYNCSGSIVETYIPESFGPFGGPAMLDTEYFQEFGSNSGGVNVNLDDLIAMFIEDENDYPNCDNVNISESRDFCLINPSYIVTTDISYICGVDGNIYENSSIASNCYGISVANDPMDCNFICGNGSVEAGEEEDGCGGDFCPSCEDIISCSNPDSTLCQAWLSTIIYNSTCDFADSQNYNFYKIYAVPYQGDTAVLFYKEQFIISDGSNEFTLYSCAGDTLYECSQGIFGDCNDISLDPVLGPIINDTLLIFDCRVDQLDCPNNNPFTTVQTITVDQNSTGLLPSYSGCDILPSNNTYLTTESVFTFMLFDNLDFPMNTNLSVDIFSNNTLVNSTTFQDTVLASTSCVWGWWDAGQFSVGDYEVRHYVENTFTGLKYLVGESNFSVIEASTQLPFITTWKTDNDGTSCSTCITIPTSFAGEVYNFDVDWENDGTYDEFGLTGEANHTYSTAGTYEIAIRGTFPRILFWNQGDKNKILNINQWGEIEWSSMEHAFRGCENLNSDAIDSPDLSSVTELTSMFRGASQFNGDISNWDVSNITSLAAMFIDAISFNQPLNNWNVSNVTNMTGVFDNASSFNQDLSLWDVSNVGTLDNMFRNAASFNQNIGNWNLANATNLSQMLDNSGVSCENYSSMLNGWTANSNTPNNLNLGAEGMEYGTNAISARNYLITQGWTFNGDTQVSCTTISDCSSTTDSILCYDWLNQIISNTSFCTDPGPSAITYKVYTTEHNGAPAILVDDNINCINPTAFGAGFTLYDCDGTQIESCTYQGNETCSNPPLDNAIIGPAYTIATLIYDSDVDALPDCSTERPFITTWKTDNAGSSCSSCITIPTIGSGYNYDVDWENDGVFDEFGFNGNASHTYASAGTYEIAIRGDFPRIYFNNEGDREKILNIDQWGDIEWTSMERAFYGCINMQSSALDVPDLKFVTDISRMFSSAESFNQDLSLWDVSNVTDMTGTFQSAMAFNGDLSQWDVSNVTVMRGLFNSADNFNRDLSTWNVSNVTDMSFMFSGATNFNQNISSWNVSSASNMDQMFRSTDNFNQDLSAWDVGNVTTMRFMFWFANIFNQDLSSWDVSNVMDMSYMFLGAGDFNQDISLWNVSSVTDMSWMFRSAENFNQDLSSWDVRNVTDMTGMFKEAIAFNLSLEDWEINALSAFSEMLDDSGIDCNNYSSTLIGWAANNSMPDNLTLGAQSMEYGTNAVSARNQLIAKGWTINGDSQGSCGNITACASTTDSILCYDWLNQIISNTSFCLDPGPSAITYKVYTTEYNGAPAILVDENINCINPTAFGAGFTLYDCDGTQIENCSYQGFETCSNPPLDNVIIGPAYTIATLIYDSEVDVLPDCNTDCSHPDYNALIALYSATDGGNWNDNTGWSDGAANTSCDPCDFNGSPWFGIECENNRVTCIDLDGFVNCGGIANNGNNLIGQLPVEIGELSELKELHLSENNLGGFIPIEISNLSNLQELYLWNTGLTGSIPTEIGNLSNLESLRLSGNQLTGTIPTSFLNLTLIESLLLEDNNLSGNLPSFLGNMPVLRNLWLYSNQFDGELPPEYANLSMVSNARIELNDNNLSGCIPTEYDQLCSSTLVILNDNPLLPWNGNFDEFCASEPQIGAPCGTTLQDSIIDSSCNCVPIDNTERPFITTWKTDNPGTSCNTCITIPTFPGQFYNYDIDWENDGIYDEFGLDGSMTHDYQTAGTYKVAIRGTFRRIYFNGGGDNEKIINIDQWGDLSWNSMEYAFAGCINLESDAIDSPDLSSVLSLSNMFSSAQVFNGDISAWDVTNITDMSGMFQLAFAFNGDLSQWDVSNVRDMRIMFSSLTDFNSDLSNWQVGDVTNMSGMFQNTDAFNADLSAWDVSKVTSMSFMFSNAISFDQSLGAWDLSAVNSNTFMLNSSALGCENYTSTLQGWAANTNTPSGLDFGAQNIEYGNEAKNARDSLINILSWTINGDVDLGKDCDECGPGSCLLENPPVWIDTQFLPDITISCASNIPDIAGLIYSNEQSEDCLIIGSVSADRDETNFDGCTGTIIETWNYTTICGDVIAPYTRSITVSSQGTLAFDVTPEASVTISCDDIDLYDISLDYMLDQGDDCIPSGSVDPIITNNYDACGGTVTFTWTINESCYGALEFVQTATILPNSDYQFDFLPEDLIVECKDLPFLPDTLVISNGIDGACGASEQVFAVSDPISQDCPGSITNTWVFVNPCTNEQITHVQNITLVDCAPPLLEEDYIEVRATNMYSLNLFDNDMLPESFSARIVEVQEDQLFVFSLLDQDGNFEFEIKESFFDTIRVNYEVCNLACDVCTTAILKIVDDALKDIFLSDIITPDGDGMNDALRFNFEAEINNVHLFIYNRWGSKVYEKLSYTNDWDASGLPGGIYYYVLKVGKAEVKKTLTVVK